MHFSLTLSHPIISTTFIPNLFTRNHIYIPYTTLFSSCNHPSSFYYSLVPFSLYLLYNSTTVNHHHASNNKLNICAFLIDYRVVFLWCKRKKLDKKQLAEHRGYMLSSFFLFRVLFVYEVWVVWANSIVLWKK